MSENTMSTIRGVPIATQNILSRKRMSGLALYGPIVANYQDGTAMNQNELISLVDAQRFKLAKLYLMQCYSGAEVEKKEILFPYEKLITYYNAEWKAGKISNAAYKKIVLFNRRELLKYSFSMVEDFSKNKCAQYPNRSFIRCKIFYSEIVTIYKENWGKEWGEACRRREAEYLL